MVRELIDCHIHTERSGHGGGTVAQMAGAAVFAGLDGIVFTEHLPLPSGIDPEHHISMPEADLEVYVAEIAEMAARVRGLEIVVGGEADWIPERADECAAVRERARAAGVSVLLGSVHFIDGWAFDDPHQVESWDDREVSAVWERYFELWCDAARSGHFDVMAHPDLVKKFGHRPESHPVELYREAARAAAEGGVCIEVSSAGLRKPVGELYPGLELLAMFLEAGVPATVGSDAHATGEVGHGIDAGYDALAASGYSRVAFPRGGGEYRWIEL